MKHRAVHDFVFGFLVLCVLISRSQSAPSIPMLGWSPVHILRNILFGVRNRDLFDYVSTESSPVSSKSEHEDGRSNVELAFVDLERKVGHGAISLNAAGPAPTAKEVEPTTGVPSSVPTGAMQTIAKVDEIESVGVDDPAELRVDPSPLLPVDLPIYGTRCYGVLGCLSITTDWYSTTRPVNVFPSSRAEVNTTFLLFQSEEENPTVVSASNATFDRLTSARLFRASWPTRFIIHGYLDTGYRTWVRQLAQALKEAEPCNVVIVDWSGGSLVQYIQSAANIRLVALEIAHLLKFLKERYRLSYGDVHLIGHSLGAHSAGHVGSLLPGIGRITALDPAEPYFQGQPEFIRLDPSDASFVDVIHTDGNSIFMLGYGMSQPCGHVDFYPNGGRNQPGCSLVRVPLNFLFEGVESASRDMVACNHQAAIKYFVESIKSKCPFMANECESYSDFLAGKCLTCGESGNGCIQMGYHAIKYRALLKGRQLVKAYTTTHSYPPYCLYHYGVTVALGAPSHARKTLKGFLFASVEGRRGILPHKNLTDVEVPGSFEHGKKYPFLLRSPVNVGTVVRVDLHWDYYQAYHDPSTLCLLVCNKHLYVANVSVSYYDSNVTSVGKFFMRTPIESNTFCDERLQFTEVMSKSWAYFTSNDSCQ